MANIGIGRRKSHLVWIIVGAALLIGIGYVWTHVF